MTHSVSDVSVIINRASLGSVTAVLILLLPSPQNHQLHFQAATKGFITSERRKKHYQVKWMSLICYQLCSMCSRFVWLRTDVGTSEECWEGVRSTLRSWRASKMSERERRGWMEDSKSETSRGPLHPQKIHDVLSFLNKPDYLELTWRINPERPKHEHRQQHELAALSYH